MLEINKVPYCINSAFMCVQGCLKSYFLVNLITYSYSRYIIILPRPDCRRKFVKFNENAISSILKSSISLNIKSIVEQHIKSLESFIVMMHIGVPDGVSESCLFVDVWIRP